MAESYICGILNAYMFVMTPLKAARKKKELTQGALASSVGVTQVWTVPQPSWPNGWWQPSGAN
jgi:hypothetical protein